MKKIILTSAIIFATVAGAFAQGTPTASASTKLNIILNPIQTITVNHQKVDLEYSTSTHYTDGITETLSNHLTVQSTGGYKVNVNSGDWSVDKVTDKITSAGIMINATGLSPVELGDQPKELITSSKGSIDKSYDVTYATTNTYIDNLFKSGTAYDKTIHSTTVTYSIEAN